MPNPSRETKLSGANADKEISIFAVELTTCRNGNLNRLIHTFAICVTIRTLRLMEKGFVAQYVNSLDTKDMREAQAVGLCSASQSVAIYL